jgi:hypothetical protein
LLLTTLNKKNIEPSLTWMVWDVLILTSPKI